MWDQQVNEAIATVEAQTAEELHLGPLEEVTVTASAISSGYTLDGDYIDANKFASLVGVTPQQMEEVIVYGVKGHTRNFTVPLDWVTGYNGPLKQRFPFSVPTTVPGVAPPDRDWETL